METAHKRIRPRGGIPIISEVLKTVQGWLVLQSAAILSTTNSVGG